MIREVALSAFKCFGERQIPLAPLTLFTGQNAAGKSTVLQAVLFLHQALTEGGRDIKTGRSIAPLNGSVLQLGAVKDVVDKVRGGGAFAIRLKLSDLWVEWGFRHPAQGDRDDLSVEVERIHWEETATGNHEDGPPELFPATLASLAPGRGLRDALASLRYVPADRIGPAETYPLESRERSRSLGGQGERAVGSLFWHGEDRVEDEPLRHPDPQVSTRLDRQVEAWLADLFPGVVVEVARVQRANRLTLGIRTSDKTDFHRPQHVGFGVTYVLPIIVALVGARHGDVVILENPEAHLHPRAQSRLGRLCALAASAGAQVLVETHSEHVLNGMRLAVHDGLLKPDDASVLFFIRAIESGEHTFERISVNRRGQLDNWFPGFFDETERALDALLDPPGGEGHA